MATKAKALKALAKWGMVIDECSSVLSRDLPTLCIDAPGRTSFDGDCRGIRESSHDLPTLWDAVIERVESEGPLMEPCPFPPGECEFHDC